MFDIDIDLEEEVDFVDDYEDEEDQAELEAAIAQAVYSTLEQARDTLANSVSTSELSEAIMESEITLDNYYSGRLELNSDADEMLAQEEKGVSAFDIKRGLLASPNVKAGKFGRYITVPFKGNNRGFNPLKLGRRLSDRAFATYGDGEAESFKRVSDQTPAYKWIHPGIKPHYVFDKVQMDASNNLHTQILDIERDFK